jgi:hypothetical protein
MQSETGFPIESGTASSTGVLAIVWSALCAPVHALLALFEPFVSFVLGLLTLLGICMSLVFEFLRPEFPLWTMLSISLSFLLVLGLYHLVLRLTAGS